MRQVICFLLISILSTTAWAGTWREDFNVNNILWGENPFGEMKIENGSLNVKSQIHGIIEFSIPCPLIPDDRNLKDYTLKTRISFVDLPKLEENEPQGIALVVRQFRSAEPIIEGYIVGFLAQDFNHASRISITKLRHLGSRLMKADELIGKDLPEPIVTGVWYDLKVVVQGNDISFLVDQDTEISTTDKDDPFTEGGYMFLLDSAQVMIDYIELSGPDIPTLVDSRTNLTTTWGKVKDLE